MRIPDSVLYTTQLFLAIFFRSPATAGTYFREFLASLSNAVAKAISVPEAETWFSEK
ncbi:MAG: hypothetical protein P2A85_25190 [Microcoleus anatoxicus]|uniref:hypothetical protein n=1 Tax=Microcoleus anatoxicus TaxID=2705319 RepID=UPI00366BD5F7